MPLVHENMKKIVLEKRTCLYLDHNDLIKSLYSPDDQHTSYSQKPELFNFKPKKILDTAGNVQGEQIKNKRKRKVETGNVEVAETETMLQPFLKEIQRFVQSKQLQNLENMPRLWEDKVEFPKFFGANNTLEFQTTHFDSQSYIIPPKSKFYNHNVEELTSLLPQLEKYDIIIMDMPWQNKYIKRLKRVNNTLAYTMMDNDSLKNIPLQQMVHAKSLVALWCTNAPQHQRAIQDEFLPAWDLKLVHTLKWFKINTDGALISPIKAEGYKQPYEMLFVACHKERNVDELKGLQNIHFLASIPSIIHSHKPPLIQWLKEYLDDPIDFKGLEIFARYLQPQFTSIGLEVLKLMDWRLYVINNENP